jgi:hypothetical protein
VTVASNGAALKSLEAPQRAKQQRSTLEACRGWCGQSKVNERQGAGGEGFGGFWHHVSTGHVP